MTDSLPPSIVKHFLIPRADQRKAERDAYMPGFSTIGQKRYGALLRERFPEEMQARDLWESVTKAELWEFALLIITEAQQMDPWTDDRTRAARAVKGLADWKERLKQQA